MVCVPYLPIGSSHHHTSTKVKVRGWRTLVDETRLPRAQREGLDLPQGMDTRRQGRDTYVLVSEYSRLEDEVMVTPLLLLPLPESVELPVESSGSVLEEPVVSEDPPVEPPVVESGVVLEVLPPVEPPVEESGVELEVLPPVDPVVVVDPVDWPLLPLESVLPVAAVVLEPLVPFVELGPVSLRPLLAW